MQIVEAQDREPRGDIPRGSGPVVFSSRVRVARNLRGVPFPGWAGANERATVLSHVRKVLLEYALLDRPSVRTMGELDVLERTVLLERRLISSELASGDATAAVLFEPGGHLSLMVNEEDHVRLQCVTNGFSLASAWQGVLQVLGGLECRLPFAFSPRYGYLTACPSNTGTGIRASVMVHLAGLRLLGEMDAVMRGLERMGYAVRGACGEGSAAFGGLYQISNQKTMGLSEAQTLDGVQNTVETVLQVETSARERLSQCQSVVLRDTVGRAYGTIRHAVLMSTGNAMDQLSDILLGVDRGLVRGVGIDTVQGLMRDIQPGHLQIRAGKTLDSNGRDEFRASYIRQSLETMEIT